MLADERAAAVDLAHLNRYTGGDLTLNTEILRLFQKQAIDLVTQLHHCLDTADSQRRMIRVREQSEGRCHDKRSRESHTKVTLKRTARGP